MITRVLRETAILAIAALLPAIISSQTLIDLHEAGFGQPVDPRQKYDDAAARYEVTAAEVRQWGQVLWVDARAPAAYEAGHIDGAVSFPPAAWDTGLKPFLARWKQDVPTVVYCDGSQCKLSYTVAGRLRQDAGLTNVFVLKGGINAWTPAK